MHRFVTAALVATLLSASSAVACPRTARADISPQLAMKLELTHDQRQRISDLAREFHQQNHAFFEEVRQTRIAFREARMAGDIAKAESLKQTAGAQRARAQELRDAHRRRIEALLTAEQRAELESRR